MNRIVEELLRSLTDYQAAVESGDQSQIDDAVASASSTLRAWFWSELRTNPVAVSEATSEGNKRQQQMGRS